MSIEILRGGPLTTIQDRGRTGAQSLGYSVAGVMDREAFDLANHLLGNDGNAAVLEVTFMGPAIRFLDDHFFVITGAHMGPKLNGSIIKENTVYHGHSGDVLEFPTGIPLKGMRAYIAFSGGIDVPLVMGSRSTYMKGKMGGFHGRKLEKGDIIPIGTPDPAKIPVEGNRAAIDFDSVYGCNVRTIRVILGPQNDKFTKAGIHTFTTCEYRVSPDSDRMGVRFEGDVIEHVGKADIVSDGIAMGAIQITNGGNPIVMMADRQSVGGYTKIAAVITADLPKIAQLKPGDKVIFRAVSVQEAQLVLRSRV